MSIKSLIINPGSTSTKIGVFEDETLLFDETLRHPTEEIAKYDSIIAQKDFRKNIIVDFLKEKNFDIHSLNVIVGRGGLLKPIPSGTYAVTDELLHDLEIGVQGQHASNLGGILAREIGDSIGVPSYIVDPVVVDELEPVARYSGVPELPRISIFHALNQKAVARRYAKETGKAYDSMNLIVVHLGGGVSVGAHHNGKVVDIFNALDGDGAFSPERSGAVPPGALVKMCFSGEYTEKEVYKKLVGNGGFNAYLGTNDMRDVEKMVDAGDEHAKELRTAFIFQLSKNIGSMATVLKGKVDQIIVTGGIAHDNRVVGELKERCEWIAPFTIYPGEDELLALAQGGLAVAAVSQQADVADVVGSHSGCSPFVFCTSAVFPPRIRSTYGLYNILPVLTTIFLGIFSKISGKVPRPGQNQPSSSPGSRCSAFSNSTPYQGALGSRQVT